MKNSTTRKLLLVATTLIAANFAASAQINTISFTNLGTVQGTGAFTNLSLTKFDTGLGTLTGIEVKVSYARIDGTFTVTTTTIVPANVTTNSKAAVTIQGSSTNLGFNTLGPITNFITTTPALPNSVPGNSNRIFDVTALDFFTNQIQNIPDTFWTDYQGPGFVNFQFNSVPLIDITGAGYSANAENVTAETSMTITYSFVPEPSTYALLAMAAAGTLGYAIRRRQRQR